MSQCWMWKYNLKSGGYNMKFHRINGIEKSVCTAEQKIAYNFALADYSWVMRSNMELWQYLDSVTGRLQENKSLLKYDIDAIIHCLRQGFIDYCKSGSHVLSSYEDIGKMFPSLYPVE